jgi:signal transduction histidine kinase
VGESEAMQIVFVGPDNAAFAGAVEALGDLGHRVRCVPSPLNALTAHTVSAPDVAVIDATRLDDQMLEVFEAHKKVAPGCVLLAAVAPSARGRAARVLRLGSDAVLSLPADAEEVLALVGKARGARANGSAEGVDVDEKFRWLGEFAAGVAHNINNPLTTVMGYLQILRADGESKEQTGHILSVMLKECDRISEIVKNLLLFSGNGNLEPRPVDVNRAVDAALVRADASVENDKVRVERAYEPGLPAVMADEEALKLACEHIAANARKAMRDGGTLSVETESDGAGHVLIRFGDTGPGVPAERRDRIFEPFYSSRNGSVGLGLATSYGIIKGFGGRLGVADGPDGGSLFQIELPAAT